MKKLVTLGMLLVMSIVGLMFGYHNLSINEIQEKNSVKIPFLSDDEPVVADVRTISKPFDDNSVQSIVSFYDITKDSQEDSIIVIDKTYIPNKGILYRNDKKFDINSIYDGTVIEVGKDDLTGNFVKINYNNNLVATYKILDDINVSKGDIVKKGEK